MTSTYCDSSPASPLSKRLTQLKPHAACYRQVSADAYMPRLWQLMPSGNKATSKNSRILSAPKTATLIAGFNAAPPARFIAATLPWSMHARQL